jgi:hypothetical protein
VAHKERVEGLIKFFIFLLQKFEVKLVWHPKRAQEESSSCNLLTDEDGAFANVAAVSSQVVATVVSLSAFFSNEFIQKKYRIKEIIPKEAAQCKAIRKQPTSQCKARKPTAQGFKKITSDHNFRCNLGHLDSPRKNYKSDSAQKARSTNPGRTAGVW